MHLLLLIMNDFFIYFFDMIDLTLFTMLVSNWIEWNDFCGRFCSSVFGLGASAGPQRAVTARQTAQVGAEEVQLVLDAVDTHTAAAGGDAHTGEPIQWPRRRLARPSSTTSAGQVTQLLRHSLLWLFRDGGATFFYYYSTSTPPPQLPRRLESSTVMASSLSSNSTHSTHSTYLNLMVNSPFSSG